MPAPPAPGANEGERALKTQQHRAFRARRALASAGAIFTILGLVTVGSGIAAAAKIGTKQPGKTTARTTVKAGKPKVTDIQWGTVGGQPVDLYTLKGAGGMKVKISQFGADIQSIDVPNSAGKLVDVVLGFPALDDYVADFEQGADQTSWPVSSGSGDVYFGGTIGRYANRIANGTFPLNGTMYKLDTNNGPNALHGGYLGWNTQVWSATPATTKATASVTMSASFPAGEGCDVTLTPACTGFPSPVNASVKFTVTKDNQLTLAYSATNESSTLATVINLTNHSYFNLGGQASGSVYNQDLAINGNEYQPTNSTQIPEAPYFVKVKGTPFNFLKGHSIGKYLYSTNMPDGTTGPIRQLQYAHGYDFNWVLNEQGKYRLDAVAQNNDTGITLWEYTDQPGVQLYTSNYLDGDLTGTTGTTYRQGQAFTLETQHYPDSPNHIGQTSWPSVVLNAGQTFTSKTAYKFGVKPSGYAKSVHFK
jgi:aldose 1-epimerase